MLSKKPRLKQWEEEGEGNDEVKSGPAPVVTIFGPDQGSQFNPSMACVDEGCDRSMMSAEGATISVSWFQQKQADMYFGIPRLTPSDQVQTFCMSEGGRMNPQSVV